MKPIVEIFQDLIVCLVVHYKKLCIQIIEKEFRNQNQLVDNSDLLLLENH
jgi:hypothetical protein